MLVQIIEVQLRGGSRLFLRFDDGAEGEVDIAEVVPFKGVFALLRDPAFFARVSVNHDWGTICWPHDLDLAPEPLYERVTGTNPLQVAAPSSAPHPRFA